MKISRPRIRFPDLALPERLRLYIKTLGQCGKQTDTKIALTVTASLL